MAINLGERKVEKVYLGQHEVEKVYLGSKIVYQKATVINTYEIGENYPSGATAILYSNGLLKISGGSMYHWLTPDDIKPLIKEVRIDDSVMAENIGSMFKDCINLEKINKLPIPDTSRTEATDMSSAFENCESLKSAPDITNGWAVKLYCFAGCKNLRGYINVYDVCNPSIVNAAYPLVYMFKGYYEYVIIVNYTSMNKDVIADYLGNINLGNILLGEQLD